MDLLQTALSRLTSYYQNDNSTYGHEGIAEPFEALIQYLGSIDAVIKEIKTITSIDESSGVQLDIIGEILGISRVLPKALPNTYFGWQETPPDPTDSTYIKGWGNKRDSNAGAPWFYNSAVLYPQTVINDQIYRRVLKTKIIKNNFNGTLQDIIKACLILLGIYDITQTTNYPLKKVRITDPGTELPYFGWKEDQNARGWGNKQDTAAGGFWATQTSPPSFSTDILIEIYEPTDALTRSLFVFQDLIPRPAAGTISYYFY